MHTIIRTCTVLTTLFLVLTLLFPSGSSSEDPAGLFKLTILYMNDPHAHYAPYEKKGINGHVGGFAKARSVLADMEAESRAEARHNLVLMAGDLLMGTPYSTAFKGELGVRLMNEMKFDAMVVGNHEFDYGKANLISRLKPLVKFPLLSENIKTSDGRYVFDRVILRKYPDTSTRVIVFGLTTADTPVMTLPDNVQGLVFADPIETARDLVADFRDEDLIVALTHLGIEVDRELAARCPKIDVIIGGHSHTKIFSPEEVGTTLICQAGAYAEYVGRLDVNVRNGKIVSHKGGLIFLSPTVKEDEKILSMIADRKTQLDSRFHEVVGETDIFLDGSMKQIRSGTDTDLGRLITGVMARSAGTDVAIMNGGAIRASIDEGPITVGEINTVLPFQDTLVKVRLTGSDLTKVLQLSEELGNVSGGKLQAFGVDLRVVDGAVRIEKVDGKDFNPQTVYSVAITSFLFAGGDGYKIFGEKGTDVEKTGLLISDLVTEFIEKHKTITRGVLETM